METVGAGATAGLIELLCLFPLDVVKTRMQLVTGNTKGLGIFASLNSLVEEGGVRRLYRGMLAPAIQEPIKRSVKFTGNSIYSKFLPDQNYHSRFICGGMAGMTEAISIAPFEVVKIRMQAANRLQMYNSSFHCAKSIFKEEGARGFALGLETALWRSGMWNANYFGAIWYLKKSHALKLDDDAGKVKTIARNFLCGLIGGTIGTVANNPFDVVVSRMRNVVPGESTPYRYALPSLVHIVRHEGVGALYKGFLAKVARLGPGGGIMIMAFDFAKQILLDDD